MNSKEEQIVLSSMQTAMFVHTFGHVEIMLWIHPGSLYNCCPNANSPTTSQHLFNYFIYLVV
jgi:hypothetical protein